jgi:peptidoglycan/LPS O-acetylase OafA/YrhL
LEITVKTMTYIPALDGIRAVAIIAVLIFHVSPHALRGGFTGVDVFFVLSGYLITRIILSDLRAGKFSFREFYLRRIQRLLPNAVFTIVATVALAAAILPPSVAKATGAHGIWALCNLSNLYIWKNLGGYWGSAAEWAPLTHTWSLAVEEQFYLIYPAILVLMARRHVGRLRAGLIVFAVVGFGLCLYRSYRNPAAAFYLLPMRGWELLLGAIVATRRRNPTEAGESTARPHAATAGWVGIALMMAGFFVINEAFHFPGWIALLPTVGTALVLSSVETCDTPVSRLLSHRAMTMIGRLSYSIYLWHWPLITLGKSIADFRGHSLLVGAFAGGLLSIALAVAAYRFVEQPLRERGAGRGKRVTTIAIGFATAMVFCIFASSRNLVADPSGRFDPITCSGLLFNAGLATKTDATKEARYYDVHFIQPPKDQDQAWKKGGIIHAFGGVPPKVVVLGSSHALMYSRVIDDICRDLGVSVAFFGVDMGGSAFFDARTNPSFPTDGEVREFDSTRKKLISEWKPCVIFAIDRWEHHQDAAEPQRFASALRTFLQEAGPLTQRVIFMSQVPALKGGNHANLREIVQARSGGSPVLPPMFPDSNEQARHRLTEAAESLRAEFPKLRILRTDLLFYGEDGTIKYTEGRKFLYADDNHLSDDGSELTRPLIERAINEALADAPPK